MVLSSERVLWSRLYNRLYLYFSFILQVLIDFRGAKTYLIAGEVGVLENVGSYLFVGGSFKIRATVQEGPPVYIENFGIWDLEKQEWLLDAGLGFSFSFSVFPPFLFLES